MVVNDLCKKPQEKPFFEHFFYSHRHNSISSNGKSTFGK
jgi:hypothetical protein